MSACSARNVAKVGAGVMSESVKRLNHSNTNKRGSPRKRKVEQLLFAKFAAHQTHPRDVNLANQDGMVQPVGSALWGHITVTNIQERIRKVQQWESPVQTRGADLTL
jgi:hypothetical protein